MHVQYQTTSPSSFSEACRGHFRAFSVGPGNSGCVLVVSLCVDSAQMEVCMCIRFGMMDFLGQVDVNVRIGGVVSGMLVGT